MSKRIVICSHIDGNGEKYTYIVPDYMDIKKGDILIAENKKYGGQSTVIALSSAHILENEIANILTGGKKVRSHIIDKLVPENTLKTVDETDPCSSSENPNYSRDVKRIADHFGYEKQKNMLIEEMAELIQALNKFDRKKNEEAYENVIEEMADVELMIDQVRYLLDINKEAIEEIKAEKVKRTRSIIDQALKASTYGGTHEQRLSKDKAEPVDIAAQPI